MLPTLTARLGLVSLAVLGLAACNKPASAPTDAAPVASDAVVDPDSGYQPLPADMASAPVAPAMTSAAATASDDLRAASEFDRTAGTANSGVDAYQFQDDGAQVRVWNDSRLGSRIVETGPSGPYIYYYRPGASDPYLLRQGEVYYVLTGGRIIRGYDARGRAYVIAPDARTRMQQRIDNRARRLREQANTRRQQKRQDARIEQRQEDRRERRQAQDAAVTTPHEARVERREDRAETAADRAEIAQDRAEKAQDRAKQTGTKRHELAAEKAQDRAEILKDRAEKAEDAAKDAKR